MMRRLLAAICVILCLLMCACTNSDSAREKMRQDSENGYGVMRTVIAYGANGKQIGKWHGKIDVQFSDSQSSMERVDIVMFDGEEPVDRVIISGAIVVVDND